MKANGGRRGIVPLLFNLSARRGWVVKDTSGRFTSGRICEPRAFWTGAKNSSLLGFDPLTLQHIANWCTYYAITAHLIQPWINLHLFFSMTQQLLMGPSLLHIEASSLHSGTPQSVGLLCRSDQPDAKTSTCNTQLSQEKDIRVPGANRTRNPSKRDAQTHTLDNTLAGVGWPNEHEIKSCVSLRVQL
jgi:hypothetical protein